MSGKVAGIGLKTSWKFPGIVQETSCKMLANSFKCFLVAARWPQYVFFGWPHVGLKKKNCWWPHVGRKRNVFGGRTFPQHKSKKMVAARWPQHFFLGGRTLASNIFFWWPHVGFKKKWWLTLASNIFFGGRTLASTKTIVVAHIGLNTFFLVAAGWPQLFCLVAARWPETKKKWWPHVGLKKQMVAARWPQTFFLVAARWPQEKQLWWPTLASKAGPAFRSQKQKCYGMMVVSQFPTERIASYTSTHLFRNPDNNRPHSVANLFHVDVKNL